MSGETDTAPAPALYGESPRDAIESTGTVVTAAAIELTALAATLVWTAFWLNVARLHVSAQTAVGHNVINAAFTVAVMVVPAVGLYLRHLARRLDHEPVAPLLEHWGTGEAVED